MTQLEDEIAANFAKFSQDWTSAHSNNVEVLHKSALFLASYKRLTALQALKAFIVERHFSQGSAAFFFEAHNDALVSHVAASSGSWRSALQSLRSVVENTLAAFYYSDHPVEMELCATGKFRLGYTDLIKYASRHPRIAELDRRATGLEALDAEYATLSQAVHASAENFRMTDPASQVLLWSNSAAKASQWATREKRTIEAVCLLIICRHTEVLKGTGLPQLREVLALVLSKTAKTALRKHGINVA